MPENLWKLRTRKGYSLPQLAAKSGIPQQALYEYEQGKPLKPSDQAKLARALYVQPNDIALVSTPPPATPSIGQRSPPSFSTRSSESADRPDARDARPPTAASTRPSSGPPARKGGKPVEDRNGPARPSQIEHLQHMAASRGHSQEQLLATVGKPLETLTLEEASKWNLHYRDLPRLVKAPGVRSANGIAVRRAALPEGLDKFEYDYLHGIEQSHASLTLTLFNGEKITGQLMGFSLYTFVLKQDTGHDVTVQKLAIAYYTQAHAGAAA